MSATPPTHAAGAERANLALRYRPRTFSELTGQRHVAAVLGRALAEGSVPQQLLFSGGSGLGKTTVARICAAAILCETALDERATGDACGRCASCLDITSPGRSHPDVIEFDAASHGGKDEVRDIATRAVLAPLRGGRKVYIIDEAHGLSGPGGQAFLKLLEEPPAHVVFMLATTDPQKMAKANRGRCTEFELLRPTDEELVANLDRVAAGEGWILSRRAAAAVVAATSPDLGVRGTVMTLEKLAGPLGRGEDPDEAALAELLGVAAAPAVAALVEAIAAGERLGALEAVEALRSSSSDAAVRSALLGWARAGYVASLRGQGEVAAELALERYRAVAGAPDGPVGTELLVARLACPALVADQAALAAQLAQAERVVAQLAALLAEARGLTPAPAQPTPPAPVPPAAAQSAPIEPPRTARSRSTSPAPSPADAAPADAAPAPEPAAEPRYLPPPSPPTTQAPPAGPADAPTATAPPTEAFLAEVASRSRRAAALLGSCEISVADGVVSLVAELAAIDRLRPLRDELHAAAAAVGATLKVRRRS